MIADNCPPVDERGPVATYTHPDGGSIRFDASELLMTASDGDIVVSVEIGQLGMLALAASLIRICVEAERGRHG